MKIVFIYNLTSTHHSGNIFYNKFSCKNRIFIFFLTFNLNYVKIDQDLTPILCPYFHQHYHEPHLWMDYETVKSNASQLDHLKMVEFKGFTSQEDELVLLDLLLHSATPWTLKSVVVISPEEQPWQVSKIPRSQLKLTSFGKRRIVVSAPNKDYFFGLT